MNLRWPSQGSSPPRSSSTVLSNEPDDSLRFPDLIITPPKQSPAAMPRRTAPETLTGARRRAGIGAPLLFLTAASALTSAVAGAILSFPELITSISSFLQRMMGP